MMKRKSAVLTDSESGSGSDSGSDIDKDMLSLARKKKPAAVEKKPKVESASSSGSSSDSDSDWADAAKNKKPLPKKKAGRRTSHRSVSGTQSSSDSENDEDRVTSSTAVPPPPASSTISSMVKSSVADRAKGGSDLEEGEVSTDDSDDSGESSAEEFNDGYDDNLMGDAEDQRRLNSMTEKEREQELFKRIEQREALRTRFEIERKLRQARKKEIKLMKRAQTQMQGSAVKMDAKERSKERKKTVEGKIDKKTEALDKLKANREAKLARAQEKDKIRLEQEKKREEEKDDDLDLHKDDVSSVVGEKKMRKLKASDIYSDDSGSDSKDDDDVKDRKRSQSSSSSSSSDSEPDERSRKVQYIESVVELNRLRLDRPRLEKWVHAPFFSRIVKNCFVRVGIGASKQNVPVYRIGEITEVVETAKIYKLEKTRTNKGAKVRHATDEKVFRFEFVSNSEFTQDEFIRWKEQCQKRNVVLPTKDEVEKKIKELKEAADYEFKEEDIEQIVREKARFRSNPVNFAVRKTELMKKKEMALQTGDDVLVEELQQEIQELDEKAKELDKARSSSIQTISFINERNRKKNVEEAEKAILEEAKANKGKIVEDPFTRRHTKPTVLHRKFNNSETNSPLASFEAAIKTEVSPSDKKDEKPALSKTLPILPPALTMDLEVPLPMDLFKDEIDGSKGAISNGDLFSAHDFDIKLDLDAKLPPNLPIVARPSIPQVQELAPRRSLNLEEYKRKKGLI